VSEANVSALSAGASIARDILWRLPLVPAAHRERGIVAAVIENHEDARVYQEGLREALLIQEYLVEGFISRFLAFFDVQQLPQSIGPVRSIREYFLDGMTPWTRTVLHAGGSPDALTRVQEDRTFTGVNGLYYPDHFLRRNGIPEPHDLFVSRDAVLELASEDATQTLWPPYTLGAPDSLAEEATDIAVNFFNPEHNVRFQYSSFSSGYERTNGRVVTGTRPRNVLAIAAETEDIGPFGRLRVEIASSGPALLFTNGKVVRGTWQREETEDGSVGPFLFLDTEGKAMPFAKGQTWMMVLDDLERVRFEGTRD